MTADWLTTFGGALIDSSARAAILAAAAGTVLLAGRVRSAHVAHTVWLWVLCAMLVMPVLPLWMPAMPVPIPTPYVPVDAGALPAFSEPAAPPRAVQSAAAPLPEVRAEAFTQVAGGRASRSSAGWPTMLFALYVGGVAALAVGMLTGWRGMCRIRRSAMPTGADPSIRESSSIAVPLTAGILRPIVVLPLAWREWPADKLQAVLAHECAHIARRDPLVRFLARLNCCLFWFHPLAWWLERKLATMAEEACDDAGVRSAGGARRYAEVLLDMAEAVRTSGGRVAWHAVGVDGNGLLGRRIDRVLRGEFVRDMTRVRKVIVGLGCATAILLVGAWRYQRAPLRESQDVAAREATQNAEREFYKAARAMTPVQLAEVEGAWKQDQQDFTALKKILIYYGHDFSGRRPENEAGIIDARRQYILWLIDNHPEHKLAGSWSARIFKTPLDPLHDPIGYEEAKRLWVIHAGRSDIGTAALSNGAWFLEANDKALAEQLLLRAQALDPKPQWSDRLGRLYAITLMGSNSSMPLNVLRTVSVEDSRREFARQVRQKLEESTDARLVSEAGYTLVRSRQFFSSRKVALDFHPAVLGTALLKKAVKIDPELGIARSRLAAVEKSDRWAELRPPLLDGAGRMLPGEKWPEIVAALPDQHRFELMPRLADREYMTAEHFDYTIKDPARAAAAWARSKEYATRTLALSSMFTDHPDYAPIVFRTHIALGAHALREGDGRTAVWHLLEAGRAPGAREFGRVDSLEGRLVHYLLKAGERESIVEFLEASAGIRPEERNRLLKDSAALRRGEMPETHQLMLARRR